ncbi:MAG: hypothetical protein AAFV53_35180 [Myxococcota bacterium]
MILFDDLRFDQHDPGPDHVERIARLAAVREGLAARGWQRQAPRMATVSELQAVHTTRHVDRVLAAAGQSVQLDPDTRTTWRVVWTA